jgi:outer membrane protein OmpA-like peptidoglycan-associated protein
VESCRAPVILEGVNFDTNATGIRPDVARVLDQLVADLKRCPEVRLRIEAHTDSVGEASYNHRLSQRRAESVRDYLVSHGISRQRLVTQGFGELRPIANNASARGRAQNRRVEIHPAGELSAEESCRLPVILEGVNFDTNATAIRPDVARVLDQLVADLERCSKVRLRIEAHTDSVGEAGYNHRLSQQRAESVRDYLVSHGISRQRLVTQGLGERRPIANNASAWGRARNRRVEVHPLGDM